MKLRRVIWGGVLLSLLLSVTANASSRHGRKKSSRKSTSKVDLGPKEEPLKPNEVLAKLNDGTSLRLMDARETEQGIWYQRGGVTYLLERARIKTVERFSPVKADEEDAEVSSETAVRASGTPPVWIYLVGGAKMEVDSAPESTAGVWFTRGPMNIFIERSRIEKIEREDPETIAKSNSSTKERRWTTGNGKIDALIKQNGAKHGVDPYLIFCVMEQESHFNARVVSPKGARGLMQLMPGTGARFGVRNAFNPGENIAGGTRYLKQLMNQFKGRVDLVLASYNAGEGAVLKFGHKVPPYRETRDYVRKISYKYHGPKKAEANHTEPKTTRSATR